MEELKQQMNKQTNKNMQKLKEMRNNYNCEQTEIKSVKL